MKKAESEYERVQVLGFHYHIPVLIKGEDAYVPGYLGRFIDSLADNLLTLVCFYHSPVGNDLHLYDYKITNKNIRWIPIGPHVSVPKRLIKAFWFRKIINEWDLQLDACLVRSPTPYLPLIANALPNTPIIPLIVGDNLVEIQEKNLWIPRNFLIWLLWKWNKKQEINIARNNFAFVNSKKIFDELSPELPRLKLVKTTTLTQTDFFQKEKSTVLPPYKLLFVGRVVRTKGVFDIIEAIKVLTDKKINVELNIVGWSDDDGLIFSEMKQLAEELGISEKIQYSGYIPMGETLFAQYRRADIFAVASQNSFEGFPRSIWEAMANSLPVVATDVGSIKEYGQGAIEIVPPNDPHALAEGILRVINANVKRLEMIKVGFELSRNNTVEYQTRELFREMDAWLGYDTENH